MDGSAVEDVEWGNAGRVKGTCRWGSVCEAFDSRQNQPNQISHLCQDIYYFFIHLNATFIFFSLFPSMNFPLLRALSLSSILSFLSSPVPSDS